MKAIEGENAETAHFGMWPNNVKTRVSIMTYI